MSTDALSRLMQQNPETWLSQTVAYFRELGFLNVTVEQAREAMIGGWEAIIPADAGDNPHFGDMFLLAECRAPVWWGDLERVYPNTNAYADLLRAWSTVARGAFAPDDIRETWDTAQKTAEVTFSLNGESHRFVHAERNGDFVDMAIVHDINRLIRHTGLQFELCDMGMPNFLIVLNAAEKSRLKHERGWRFEDAISGSSN